MTIIYVCTERLICPTPNVGKHTRSSYQLTLYQRPVSSRTFDNAKYDISHAQVPIQQKASRMRSDTKTCFSKLLSLVDELQGLICDALYH